MLRLPTKKGALAATVISTGFALVAAECLMYFPGNPPAEIDVKQPLPKWKRFLPIHASGFKLYGTYEVTV